ncbi:hypothetical protein ACFYZB_20275 [Streptomyces sp. NPDC001852]|uniref:hypothetical protein n=1 Tax=Streptomyces sp. NPDC001852 TaxID=3364619 RepID=UPI00367605B6
MPICRSWRSRSRAGGGRCRRNPNVPHLVQALDEVMRKLGGTARRRRFDRMAMVGRMRGRYRSEGLWGWWTAGR